MVVVLPRRRNITAGHFGSKSGCSWRHEYLLSIGSDGIFLVQTVEHGDELPAVYQPERDRADDFCGQPSST